MIQRPGKVCLVTGGGGPRIGSGICRVLTDQGWHVVVTDMDIAAAHKVAENLAAEGSSAEARQMDTSDPASVQETIRAVGEAHGRIDGLVNSAGIGLVRPVEELGGDDFERLIAVDLRGPLICSQQVVPFMRSGGGSIVNIGSVQALASLPSNSVYAAAKAGLVGLTRGLARDLGRYRIRCNIIHPGQVLSSADLKSARANGQNGPERWPKIRQLLARPIEGTDIGGAVAFLLSDEARAITGIELVVDAGTTAMLADNEDPLELGSRESVGAASDLERAVSETADPPA